MKKRQSNVIDKKLDFPLVRQTTAIVLNGARTDLFSSHLQGDWSAYDCVIVADGAWDDFIQTTIGKTLQNDATTKLIALGDGDSIGHRPADFIAIGNQDSTDFEKSLQYAINKDKNHADVFWASGGEMDHFLGNLSVANYYATQINLRFFDQSQCYFHMDKNIILNQVKGQIISLYPFPEAVTTSQGLRYPLNALRLDICHQQSLRNEASQEQVKLVMHSGTIFCFVTV